jgi:hypothetical protein
MMMTTEEGDSKLHDHKGLGSRWFSVCRAELAECWSEIPSLTREGLRFLFIAEKIWRIGYYCRSNKTLSTYLLSFLCMDRRTLLSVRLFLITSWQGQREATRRMSTVTDPFFYAVNLVESYTRILYLLK